MIAVNMNDRGKEHVCKFNGLFEILRKWELWGKWELCWVISCNVIKNIIWEYKRLYW